MSWFFVAPGAVAGDQVTLDPDDSHHLLRVLRAQSGEAFTAVAGGTAYRCRLAGSAGGRAVGAVVEAVPVQTEPPVAATVFQGLAKGDKLEWVIQKVTELGAAAVVPVECARSVVRLEAKKAAERVARWQRIAREAAQQSRRGQVPVIEPVQGWAQAARRAQEFDLALVAWEREAGAPGLRDRLAGVAPGARLALYVGPEGGLTEAEAAAAAAAGAHLVGLGPRILRTETAALAALAAALYAVGDLG